MSPKSRWPPAQAEDHSYSNGCVFQGASHQELPAPTCSSEGSGCLRRIRTHAHAGLGATRKHRQRHVEAPLFFLFLVLL